MKGKHLRWGAALSVIAFVCVLALAGGAGARLDTYHDPLEGYQHLDVTTVTADDNTAGYFTIYVYTKPPPDGQKDIQATDAVSVYIDTDRNVNDGDGGAEYQLYLYGTGTGTSDCGVYHYNGSTGMYDKIQPISCDFNYGTVFQFPRSSIGNPEDIRFYVRSYYGNPQTVVDRAPDTGWWLFDPTPPGTTITGGPSGSTTSTDATFSFASSEAGSSFQCSLDGGGFGGCGSPAVYHNLSFATHTFQVRAIDPSRNIDPTPAARSWTVVDGTPPTARAVSGTCCDSKGRATVTYTLGDNTGRAAASVSIGPPGRKPANTCSYEMNQARPDAYDATCKVPASARGWLSFCVQARDAAGNKSAANCKPLSFGRLRTRVIFHYDKTLRITHFIFDGREGAKVASIKCFGCKLSSRRHPVGTRMPAGARIEVRLVKPRVRGNFIQLISVRGTVQEPPDRCLPPGLSKPVISCRRTR